MNKLEQAARQALDALESCNVGNWSMAFDEFAVVEAIAALRKAIAEPELNLNCRSVQKRLATVWGYVKAEQAEQEPVVCGCGATAYCLIRHTNLPEHNFTPICLSCLQEHEQNAQEVNEHEMNNFGGAYGLVTWETKPLYAAPVLTKDMTDELQQKCSDWGTYWRASDAHGVNLSIEQATELLRDALGVEVEITHPVRTKDLTDDEILELWRECDGMSVEDYARAVIAAYKEKNKC